jgi:hypothetical protein
LQQQQQQGHNKKKLPLVFSYSINNTMTMMMSIRFVSLLGALIGVLVSVGAADNKIRGTTTSTTTQQSEIEQQQQQQRILRPQYFNNELYGKKYADLVGSNAAKMEAKTSTSMHRRRTQSGAAGPSFGNPTYSYFAVRFFLVALCHLSASLSSASLSIQNMALTLFPLSPYSRYMMNSAPNFRQWVTQQVYVVQFIIPMHELVD